ncbi:hypothetical protein GCM10022404_01310 [Celeribacter arenosi]|uniref:Uncharacterized protein n=1 Tax=Celeribacter arenosi TaxID=792649 RepID=A0ABP7JSS1_9RHOB
MTHTLPDAKSRAPYPPAQLPAQSSPHLLPRANPLPENPAHFDPRQAPAPPTRTQTPRTLIHTFCPAPLTRPDAQKLPLTPTPIPL